MPHPPSLMEYMNEPTETAFKFHRGKPAPERDHLRGPRKPYSKRTVDPHKGKPRECALADCNKTWIVGANNRKKRYCSIRCGLIARGRKGE